MVSDKARKEKPVTSLQVCKNNPKTAFELRQTIF